MIDSANSFSVAFDPLDGSSIVDTNFAVGSIVGIWPGQGLLNRTGREQVHFFGFNLAYLVVSFLFGNQMIVGLKFLVVVVVVIVKIIV